MKFNENALSKYIYCCQYIVAKIYEQFKFLHSRFNRKTRRLQNHARALFLRARFMKIYN